MTANTNAADIQLGHLRRAALAFGEWLETHPQLADPSLPADPASNPAVAARMLAEKGDHLAACAATVDQMCCEGYLPTDWQPRSPDPLLDALADEGERVEAEQARYRQLMAADPRVTANGGAAAKAGWNLAAPADKVLGPARVELMGHRIRFGIVSEVTLLGEQFLRIDFPQDDENTAPEFYRPAAVYGILPGELPGVLPHAVEANPFGERFDELEDPF